MTLSSTTDDAGALQPKKSSLLRSSTLMASGTMVSRILGFVRAAMLLAAIGVAGGVGESFQVANSLPNTVYNLLASGILDAILIPQIIRALKSRAGTVYVNRLITAAGTVLFALTFLAMVAAPLLVTLLSPKFDGEMRQLTIAFSLWCLPQLFFYGLYNLWGEVLNARGIFGPYMWAPIVNNIVSIAGLATFLVIWGPSPNRFPVNELTSTQFYLLAITATLGVVLQALILLIPLRNSGVKLRLDFHFKGTDFGSVSKVAGWTFATLLVSQIGVISTYQLGNRAAAWNELATGPLVASMPAYNTAFMLYMVPQSLIAVTLTTAIFTRLANSVANGNYHAVAKDYHTGVRLITMLSMAAAAVLIVAAVPIMQLINPTSGTQSASMFGAVLVALVMGIPSTGIILISQRVFFAFENAKPVFLMGIIPTLLQVVIGWGIYFTTQDSPKWWMVAAAVGETACRVLQGFIAIIWTAHMVRTINAGKVIASYLLYLFAFVVSALPAWGILHLVSPVSSVESGFGRFFDSVWKIFLVAIVVAIVFIIVLRFIDPSSTNALHKALSARLGNRSSKSSEHETENSGSQSSKSNPNQGMRQTSAIPARGDSSYSDEVSQRVGDDWNPVPPAWDDIVTGDDASKTLARALGSTDPSVTGQIPIIRQHPGSGNSFSQPDSDSPSPLQAPWDLPSSTMTTEPQYDSLQSPPPQTTPSLRGERTSYVSYFSDLGSVPDRPKAPQKSNSFNPVGPSMILGLVVVIAGIVFAFSSLKDLGSVDLIPSGTETDQSTSQPEVTAPPAPEVVAPVISGVTVFSWLNDDQDHPELAAALLDGNPETLWYSRYYDINTFGAGEEIALLVNLQQEAVVSEIILDFTGSGGDLVVRIPQDGNPRAGEVLTTTAVNGQTVITLPQPTKLSQIGLAFSSLPIDDEGVPRAKIANLAVR